MLVAVGLDALHVANLILGETTDLRIGNVRLEPDEGEPVHVAIGVEEAGAIFFGPGAAFAKGTRWLPVADAVSEYLLSLQCIELAVDHVRAVVKIVTM